jgi:hypothetical protein
MSKSETMLPTPPSQTRSNLMPLPLHPTVSMRPLQAAARFEKGRSYSHDTSVDSSLGVTEYELDSRKRVITIDTNADTNPHEQLRTRAMREQKKYAYLQEFLNTGEQPRYHRPAIPLNGVSRVRIPPPPLFFTPFCRANTQAKDERCGSSSPFDINFDTNVSPWKSAAFAWQRSRVRVSSGPLNSSADLQHKCVK